MEIYNGICMNGESLIHFSQQEVKHPYNNTALCSRGSTNPNSFRNTVRHIDGPLLVSGDILIKGDIIGCNNIVGSSQYEYDNYSTSMNIRELNRTILHQEQKINDQNQKIYALENIINLLCEKFNISSNNLDLERKKLQDRTEVQKRLDSI